MSIKWARMVASKRIIVATMRPRTAKFPSSTFLKRAPLSGTNTLDRPQTTTGNKSSFQREVSDVTLAMERLKYYIRESALSFEDVAAS